MRLKVLSALASLANLNGQPEYQAATSAVTVTAAGAAAAGMQVGLQDVKQLMQAAESERE